MGSKKPVDSDSAPLPNVKIKVEPGTSSSSLLKNVKTEPGLSTTTTRLTSFRVPRDLTLGAATIVKTEKPKKVYMPNINAQRNKKKEDGGPIKKESKPARGKSRGRGQNDRGRGRGKTPSNLIQSTGVFSEGITDSTRTGRRFAGYHEKNEENRDNKKFMPKPLLNLNQTIDKAGEEEKLKTLLRDDFIDDESDPALANAPVTLPLIDEAKLYKRESKMKIETKVGPEEEEIDVKPIILANGEAVMPCKSLKAKLKPRIDQKEQKPDNTVSQVIETNGYILIQFPDCLPGLRTSEEPTDPRSRKQTEQNPPPPTDSTAKSEFCTLASLKGGLLGKIEICKSGKSRFVVGDNTMIVDLGSRPSFRQDLVATKIDADNASGELVNLGRINSTLICSPDWETMLASL